jgi:short-subunit dehydrogenase
MNYDSDSDGYVSCPVYAGTKGYVRLFSESLWYTEKKRGVYVMCLLPGITKTLWHEHAGGSAQTSYPSLISQTATQCADEAIDALYKRKDPVVITGKHNRLAAFLTRCMPRSAIIAAQGKKI